MATLRKITLNWEIRTGAITCDTGYIKRQELCDVDLYVTVDGTAYALDTSWALNLSIKPALLGDNAALVAVTTWTASATTGLYQATAQTIGGTALDTYLAANNADTTDDEGNKLVDLDVYYTVSMAMRAKSDTVTVICKPDVGRADDTVPATIIARNDFLVSNGTGLLVNVAAGYAANGAFVAAQASLAITNATNYIEATAAGVASVNTTAFTAGSYPLATVVASAGAITANTDLRAWITPKPATAGGVTSITGTANEITVTGTTTPTLSLPSALTFTGKTITGGTFNSGAFNGTVGATTPSTVAGTTGTFDSTVTVGANSQAGTLNVKDSGGTTTASIDGSDGSASFASGGCTISQAGGIDADSLYSDWVRIGGVNGNAGSFHLRDNSGTTKASIDGVAGTASFLNGAVVITDSPYNQIDAYGIILYIGTVYADNALNISYDGGVTQLVTIGANNGTEAWIHSDGTASFLSGAVVITDSPYNQISAPDAALYIDTVYADNGLWINDGVTTLASLDSDGTAQFKTGAITLGKNTGTAAYIDENGNASFSNGQTVVEYGDVSSYQFTAEYNVTIGSNSLAGTLNVKDSSDTTTASIDGADGSASFGYQGGNIGLMIDQYGNITTNNSAEATLYNLHADNLLTVGKSGNAGTLNVKDSSDTTTASIDGSSGTLTLAGALIGGTQALVTSGGAGAVNLTTLTTEVETTGTLDALTLANGTVGQIKVITHTVGAFTSVLTPTTAVGFTSITFLASLGQTCTLEYTNAGWVILAVGGLTLPVVA